VRAEPDDLDLLEEQESARLLAALGGSDIFGTKGLFGYLIEEETSSHDDALPVESVEESNDATTLMICFVLAAVAADSALIAASRSNS
jgi:hypothetical protein